MGNEKTIIFASVPSFSLFSETKNYLTTISCASLSGSREIPSQIQFSKTERTIGKECTNKNVFSSLLQFLISGQTVSIPTFTFAKLNESKLQSYELCGMFLSKLLHSSFSLGDVPPQLPPRCEPSSIII